MLLNSSRHSFFNKNVENDLSEIKFENQITGKEKEIMNIFLLLKVSSVYNIKQNKSLANDGMLAEF